jgi:hypothetical protein
MPQNTNQSLEDAETAFVAQIAEILRRRTLTRDEAQAKVSYHITGAWNRLDSVINELPIKLKQENGKVHK